MRVLIIEDEKIAADKLERQLLQYDSDIEILAKIDSIEKAVKWLSEDHADLIFLDIHLSDGLSFNIFEQIEIQTPIIFTTAYDAYAIQAFKLNSIDYLLKPINKGDLEIALQKFKKLNEERSNPEYLHLIALLKGQKHAFQERFMVYTGEKIKSVAIHQVAYFFAEGKYVFLVNKEGQQFIIDFTLSKLQQKLDPALFFRINRKFIIHIDSIRQMVPYSKARLKIDLTPAATQDVIVSIERSMDFKRWLNM